MSGGNSEVIKEFLVSIGYQEHGRERFDRGLITTANQAKELGKSVLNAAKDVIEFASQVAEQFESLYFSSQRIGATAENITALGFAAGRAGSSAEGMTASLENMGRFLRVNPGATSFFASLGVQARNAQGQLRDTSDIMLDTIERLQARNPAVAAAYAQVLGIDEKTLLANLKELREFNAEYHAMQAAVGLNSQAATSDAHKLRNELGLLGAGMSLLGNQFAATLIRRLGPDVRAFRDLLRDNLTPLGEGLTWVGERIGDVADIFTQFVVRTVRGVTDENWSSVKVSLGALGTSLKELGAAIQDNVTREFEHLLSVIPPQWKQFFQVDAPSQVRNTIRELEAVTRATGGFMRWYASLFSGDEAGFRTASEGLLRQMNVPANPLAGRQDLTFWQRSPLGQFLNRNFGIGGPQPEEQQAPDPHGLRGRIAGPPRNIFQPPAVAPPGSAAGNEVPWYRRAWDAVTGGGTPQQPPAGQLPATPGQYGPVLDLIGRAEGTDRARGYNETLANGRLTGGDVNLVGMTMREIQALQTQMLAHPGNRWNSSAVGRYQFTRSTLFGTDGRPGLLQNLGIGMDERFDRPMQDRLAIARIQAQGGLNAANLSQIWASLPDPSTGLGYYPGQRTPHATVAQVEAAIRQTQQSPVLPGPRATPPVQAPRLPPLLPDVRPPGPLPPLLPDLRSQQLQDTFERLRVPTALGATNDNSTTTNSSTIAPVLNHTTNITLQGGADANRQVIDAQRTVAQDTVRTLAGAVR